MPTGRRNEIRNALLISCSIAAGVGLLAVAAFFTGAFDVTVAHLKAIAAPTLIVIAINTFAQYAINEKLLRDFFRWFDETESEHSKPSVELAAAAQKEMVEFPIFGSAASMGLWIFAAFFVAGSLGIFSDAFSARHLAIIFFAVIAGGAMATIFLFYFSKVQFRRMCVDLFAVQTDFFDRLDSVKRISYHAKLMLSLVTLLTVGLSFAALMGNGRAAGALVERRAQLMKPIAQQLRNMRSNQTPQSEIELFLTRVSFTLGEDIFLFDNQGKTVYGKTPKDLSPDAIVGFLKEYDSFVTKIVRWNNAHNTRNLPDSSDVFVWFQVNDNEHLGSVFRWNDAKSVLSSFNNVFIILILFFMGVSIWITRLAANDVSGPLKKIVEAAKEIGEGDLSKNIAILSEDEMSNLAAGLTTMVNGLRGLVARVGRASEQVDEAAENITGSQAKVSEGAFEQARLIEDNTLIAGAMGGVVSDISENVEVMADNAQQSINVILDMERLSKEVSENIGELSVSVESTTSAIYEMNATIKEIHESVEALSAASEETAASMLEMDRAIKEVEDRAQQTLDISESVTKNASEGVVSVQSTIEGIGKVEEGVREASEVINRLGNLAEEIGAIVAVINDIADQTNLLALNAAIIAAQAGERGRGFAVVADEIKKLSERTTTSTKEIRDLINRVQSESQKAVSVMERESQSVETGVNLAFQAGQALEKIQKSAQNSGEMVRLIAKATAEQANNSKRVTAAVESIAERVSQIASSIHQQARGADQITGAAGEMKEIAPVVKSKALKQVENGKQVSLAIENIGQMIDYVRKSQTRQKEQAEKIIEAMDKIKFVCQANVGTVSKLDETVQSLSQQSDSLKDEIKRFQLPQEDIDVEFE